MYSIDVRGECCPTPVLRTKKQLNEMKTGETLEVLATDQLAPLDIEALINVTKDKLISVEEEEDYYKIVVEKA